jgi:hypothetical protein
MAFHDLARMTIASVGAGGTLTLGTAAAAGLTFVDSGMVNGETVTYGIVDGNAREVGIGVFNTANGGTLTRNVRKSTNANAQLTGLTSAAVVFVAALSNEMGIETARTFYQSGIVYPLRGGSANGGALGTAGLICLGPLLIRARLSWNELWIHITTAVANSLSRIDLYKSHPVTGHAIGDPVWASPTFPSTTQGVSQVTAGPTAGGPLDPGLYWTAWTSDTATVAFAQGGANTPDIYADIGVFSGQTQWTANTAGSMTKSGVTFGTWPTFTGQPTTDGINSNGTLNRNINFGVRL